MWNVCDCRKVYVLKYIEKYSKEKESMFKNEDLERRAIKKKESETSVWKMFWSFNLTNIILLGHHNRFYM